MNAKIATKMNTIFQDLCIKGNLEEIKQFYFDNPTVNISADNEMAFCNACENGHLEVAKWLLEVNCLIRIFANNEWDIFQ